MVVRGKRNASQIAFTVLLYLGVSHAALALPSGGTVISGQATISPPSGGAITITQSTTRAIIDWSKFSIAANQSVTFNNGSGATLNRVTGADASLIDGALNATGSVYIVNPNGVIIGKSGVVNTGGSFVASTLDVANKNFNSGDPLTFSGASSAAVINLGYIGAAGRDVVLMAYEVQNTGTISAPNGDIGLLAGSTILLRDMETDGGMFAVQIGGAGTSVTNSGQLQAAMVELRANGGNVFALAGNATGVINATGVSTKDGQVFLTAGRGRTDVQAAITATQSDGAGGNVTTSGATVDIIGANISAGNWTIQQDDFVLTPVAAAILSSNLETTSITVKTIGTDGSPSGGDITIPVSLSWSGDNSLTLSAHRDIDIASGQPISNDGDATITLAADNEGRGIGTVKFGSGSEVSTGGAVSIFYNPAGNDQRSVNGFSYINPTDYSGAVSAGNGLTSYMLVNTVYDLQNIQNDLSGNYALGRAIDAGVTANWNVGAGFMPIGTTTDPFAGILLDDGHSITNLTINSSAQYVGLFAVSTGTISGVDIKSGNITATDPGVSDTAVGSLVGFEAGGALSNVSDSVTIIAANYSYVGGLVGLEQGAITNSSSSGSVSDVSTSDEDTYIGGLVGVTQGAPATYYYPPPLPPWEVGRLPNSPIETSPGFIASLSYSDSTANVGGNAKYAGGLVGGVLAYSTITNAYAAGTVNVTALAAGGFVGLNEGSIDQSWSANIVSGTGYVGGFVGSNDGGISESYSTGSATGGSVGGFVGSNSGDISSSYSIGSATGIADTVVGGFGGSNSGTISNSFSTGSAVGVAATAVGGLVGSNSGTISNSYSTGSAEGLADSGTSVGGFVGSNSGSISNSYSMGSATAVADVSNFVGGFAGSNTVNATIAEVYSTGSATGAGLIGQNGGTVTFAYWDIGASGDKIAVSNNTGLLQSVRGLGGTTHYSPFSASSYVGFDFTYTWGIDRGVSWPTLN
jgi:filamentous hemagglutinin family protein